MACASLELAGTFTAANPMPNPTGKERSAFGTGTLVQVLVLPSKMNASFTKAVYEGVLDFRPEDMNALIWPWESVNAVIA